jgi:hypothetical protein
VGRFFTKKEFRVVQAELLRGSKKAWKGTQQIELRDSAIADLVKQGLAIMAELTRHGQPIEAPLLPKFRGTHIAELRTKLSAISFVVYLESRDDAAGYLPWGPHP